MSKLLSVRSLFSALGLAVLALHFAAPAQGATSPEWVYPLAASSVAPVAEQVFLPLVAGSAGQPVETPQQSSIQLIQQAVSAGELTVEQGLIHQVQAVVGDPALPARFAGDDSGLDGSTTYYPNRLVVQ